MTKRIPIIGVMGSRSDEQAELTVPLGKMIARKGYHLLTGGGYGVMQKVSEAFCSVPKNERVGVCIGIIPTVEESGRYIVYNNFPNPYVEVPIITPLPPNQVDKPGTLNRNYINILTSNAIVALAGGTGTANEIELTLQFGKPLILFGSNVRSSTYPTTIPTASTLKDVERFLEERLG